MAEAIEALDIAEIENRVNRAIANFGNDEQDLLVPLGSEQNIAQRFARWLEDEFPDWNVDCEYNRIVDGISRTAHVKVADLFMHRVNGGFEYLDEPLETRVIPDIIIHRRATQENLIAIEIKTHNNRREIEFDFEKLRAYIEYEPLCYRFALFIRFQSPDNTEKFIAESEYFSS